MKSKVMKSLVVAVCAIALIAVTIAGTVAYLTDIAEVKNTFTVGNVGITLDEAKVTEYGVEVVDADRVKQNEYKLIPGHTYKKDPTIHVDAGSENCYIFFALENGLGADATFNIDLAKWTKIDSTDVYYYNEVATAESDCIAFTQFVLRESAVVSNYETAEITVTAYAVQADGFNTAADAWAATFGAPTT